MGDSFDIDALGTQATLDGLAQVIVTRAHLFDEPIMLSFTRDAWAWLMVHDAAQIQLQPDRVLYGGVRVRITMESGRRVAIVKC